MSAVRRAPTTRQACIAAHFAALEAFLRGALMNLLRFPWGAEVSRTCRPRRVRGTSGSPSPAGSRTPCSDCRRREPLAGRRGPAPVAGNPCRASGCSNALGDSLRCTDIDRETFAAEAVQSASRAPGVAKLQENRGAPCRNSGERTCRSRQGDDGDRQVGMARPSLSRGRLDGRARPTAWSSPHATSRASSPQPRTTKPIARAATASP